MFRFVHNFCSYTRTTGRTHPYGQPACARTVTEATTKNSVLKAESRVVSEGRPATQTFKQVPEGLPLGLRGPALTESDVEKCLVPDVDDGVAHFELAVRSESEGGKRKGQISFLALTSHKTKRTV